METCKFFVVRKKRFCKMNVAKGKEYCGEHDKEGKDESEDSKRIPCPLDPKHTVYTNKLKKHLKICNARPREDVPKYIKTGVNWIGSPTDPDTSESNKFSLQELAEDELNSAIEKINELFKKFVEGKIEKLEYQHESLKEEVENPSYGHSTLKHVIQTSAILGIMNHLEFLQPHTCFIEYGAGKGGVSFWLAKSIENFENSKVLLLDKASHRHKKDNKIENRDLVKRVLCDIADFDLQHLDLLENCKKIIGVSKHLCGVATDLTLRCIMNGNQCKKTRTDGFLIALCCHHKCIWSEFVGQKFFVENGITERMFRIFIKIVSWSVCGTGISREKRRELESKDTLEQPKANASKLDRKTREEIGWKCKRIIDYARIHFLSENGYEASLKYYCDQSVTLENVCIVGQFKEN